LEVNILAQCNVILEDMYDNVCIISIFQIDLFAYFQ